MRIIKLTELISQENINLSLKATTKKDMFSELSELLVDSGVVKKQKLFIKDLLKREKEASTGIGFKLAIPHAKSKAVSRAAVAVGRVAGIKDYETLDGDEVEMIFMIAVPNAANDDHLKILSLLARKFMNEDFRNKLFSAEDEEEMMAIFESSEI